MELEAPPRTNNADLDIWLDYLVDRLRHVPKHEGIKLEISGTDLHLSGTGNELSPSLYHCLLQVRKNAGKSELIAIFPTGVEQQIAVEP